MLQPKLYLCPTPIGNMEDMTLRALRVLRECHRIYCEDTRNTGAMLSRLGISKPLISCYEHNEEGRAEEIGGRGYRLRIRRRVARHIRPRGAAGGRLHTKGAAL